MPEPIYVFRPGEATVSFRCDRQLIRDLNAIASRAEVTRSELIRALLVQAVQVLK